MSGTITAAGLSEVTMRFRGATRELHDRLLAAMREETAILQDYASARMGELFHNPGRMQASLSTDVVDGGTTIEGTVQASGLPYLAIHEYGGVTAPHDIFPRNASVLAFVSDAAAEFRTGATAGTDMVFAKVVHHPGSVMPERSYMRYALAQRRSLIQQAFLAAAASVFEDLPKAA